MRFSITGRARHWIALLALGATNIFCAQSSVVDVNRYDAFWLWAGVTPQPALAHARTVYLLDAEVRPGKSMLISQRPALPHVQHADVWMVVRVETLDWSPTLYSQVLSDLARWRQAGNRIAGLQIDFDANTHRLEEYAAFLKDLRRRLPADYKLGITGLLDWSSHGDPQGLDALAGAVDEVVLQIYQGRHVIPGYEQYLTRLDRLKIPFRIGLLENGEWQQPANLASNLYFRGFVVFLLNP
ncbi:DUF3142 domain-containing protein [Terriglobus sp. YAF25]|uniref:DUF3142 domain-containing protein n=1 Tax=Terriglobus sp. YAF25 TaxID=3233080 RepID=UPI003F9C7389